jgi:hypothetical protein
LLIRGKFILQDLWKKHLDWNDEIDDKDLECDQSRHKAGHGICNSFETFVGFRDNVSFSIFQICPSTLVERTSDRSFSGMNSFTVVEFETHCLKIYGRNT